jgi:hypothetical protein
VQPSADLVESLFGEKVRVARGMSLTDRLLAGPRLFDLACEFAKAGIRAAAPDADEQRVMELLRQRLALARRLEKGP